MGGLHARRSPPPTGGGDPDEPVSHGRHQGVSDGQPADAESSEHAWVTLGLPEWISRVAMFGAITTRAIRAAAASAGQPLQASQVRDLTRQLEESGLLITRVGSDPVRRLRPGIRRDMIESLEREHGSLDGLRHALIGAGAGLGGSDLPHLAPDVWDVDDWSILEHLILSSTSELECISQGTVVGAMDVPRLDRQQRPILSVAYAVSGAVDAVSGVLDLGLLTRLILRDARELHGGWRHHSSIDASVVAGSLWMISQASSELTNSSHELDEAWATHQDLEEVIRGSSRNGPLPSAGSLALFHTLSSVVAVLRADWVEANRHAEPAMLLAPECGLVGFVAAGMLSISSYFSGSSIGRTRSERFFRMHRQHGCRSLSWMAGMAQLPEILGAITDLDRDRIPSQLTTFTEFNPARWFDDSMLLHCAAAKAGMLWSDPHRALAVFDGAVTHRWSAERLSGRAQLVAGRTRVELLINVGELDEAGQLLDTLRAAYGTRPLIALTARWQLSRGDYSGALSLADEALSGAGSPARRATLLVMKAAALMLSDSSDAAVDRALTAACVICEESRTLLPFGNLPRPVLIDLLAIHGPHPDGQPCFVHGSLTPAKIATLQPGYPAIEQPVRLTPRERTLLPLLATPDTLGEIADQLYVSINTVRKQVATLREKLGAKDRRELVARAHELRLLPDQLN
jgi:DNA-binding CsgD family transcriptional regulator